MPHAQQIEAWNVLLFSTPRNLSWLLAERWEGKDLRIQGERRCSSLHPELAEMLEANQEIGFSPWIKSTVGALKCHIRSFAKKWIV